jgi:hypothetical protein
MARKPLPEIRYTPGTNMLSMAGGLNGKRDMLPMAGSRMVGFY